MADNEFENSPLSKSEQQAEKIQIMLQEMQKNLRENRGVEFVPAGADAHLGFAQSECPYGKCGGGGYTVERRNGRELAVRCDCYLEEVLRRKMRQAGIDERYFSAGFDFEHAPAVWLKPKRENQEAPEEAGTGKKKRVVRATAPEKLTPQQYIERRYEQRIIENAGDFGRRFTGKALRLLNEKPRQSSNHLMLLGESGRGKTHLACAIGREFLRNGKTVHFSTLETLITDWFNPDVNVKQLLETVDLLIVDEVGWEHHSDSGYAMKKIKDFFRMRYNSHLPVICTSNLYPNEFGAMYDKSIMSVFSGHSFYWVWMQGEEDNREKQAIEQNGDADLFDQSGSVL